MKDFNSGNNGNNGSIDNNDDDNGNKEILPEIMLTEQNINDNNDRNNNNTDNDIGNIDIDVRQLMRLYSQLLHGCIVSTDDIYTTQYLGLEVVGRVAEVTRVEKSAAGDNNENDGNNDNNNPNKEIGSGAGGGRGSGSNEDDDEEKDEENGEDDEEDGGDYEIEETHRGVMGHETEIYFKLENPLVYFNLTNSTEIPSNLPHKDLINVITKDDECFPVLRRLLRPCIALTAVVQNGRGIYRNDKNDKTTNKTTNHNNHNNYEKKNENKNENKNKNETENENVNGGAVSTTVRIEVEACAFDMVLLYLEHEVRTNSCRKYVCHF